MTELLVRNLEFLRNFNPVLASRLEAQVLSVKLGQAGDILFG